MSLQPKPRRSFEEWLEGTEGWRPNDLPGTPGARVQWATGRGNFQRTAAR